MSFQKKLIKSLSCVAFLSVLLFSDRVLAQSTKVTPLANSTVSSGAATQGDINESVLPEISIENAAMAIEESGVDTDLLQIIGDGTLTVEKSSSDTPTKTTSSYLAKYEEGKDNAILFTPFKGIPDQIKNNATMETSSYYLNNSSLAIIGDFGMTTYSADGAIIITLQKLIPN
ncbi:MAG: hypothetical protein A3F67_10395 [Verrucomicrobia bacterium RIFCSPHIGHO2_12_FULL_41_10]|nr:MAG: hypothetical protein A3F67_10395 [Verrucomicrobia bacterium RIFCSPHIGHO2_12_FULL_41_10]HLB34653.1 hypothetical protein [Chthoniobacterales bacterium]